MTTTTSSLWNGLPRRWTPTGNVVTFVVGKDDAEQQTFQVDQSVICEVSPVVKAAMSGDFTESNLHEMRLQHFVPNDFELFLRLVQQVGAFAEPPGIAVVINDHLVLCVLPIAAYLGVQQMIKLLETHVHSNPTLATVLAFEKCASDDVDWGVEAYACLFTDFTIAKPIATSAMVQVNDLFRNAKETKCGTCKHYSHFKCTSQVSCKGSTSLVPALKPLVVHLYDVKANTHVLNQCSAKTIRGFVDYLIKQKCLHVAAECRPQPAVWSRTIP